MPYQAGWYISGDSEHGGVMEEINEMPAGREMDELIATKIFGWLTARLTRGLWNPKNHDSIHYSCDEPDEVLPYSTDIAAAWQIIEKIGGEDKSAEKVALAICHAALKAVGS